MFQASIDNLVSMRASLVRFGVSMCNDVHTAEDVVQNVTIWTMKKMDSQEWESEGHFRNTVFSMMRKRMVDKFRAESHYLLMDEKEEAAVMTADDSCDLEYVISAWQDSVDDEKRTIVTMLVEGFTNDEIFSEMGIARATYFRLLAEIRENLTEWITLRD